MPGQNQLIFLVEDDSSLCRLIQLGLTMGGYRVQTASDGDEAKSKLLDITPDLIILDLYIPGCDGLQVLDWIRKERCLNTPVLILSAAGISEKELLSHGANGFLPKPIKLETIATRVTELLATVGQM